MPPPGTGSPARSTRCTSTPCYARGGQGQDFGRLGREVPERGRRSGRPRRAQMAPWAALAYDGSPAAAAEAARVLDEVQLDTLPPQGAPAGPDYQHYWIDRVRPGSDPALAAALAGTLRPGGLADHSGLLAADVAAGRAGRADRDPDLPQPAAAVAADTDRRLGSARRPQSAARPPRSPGSPSPQSGSPSPRRVAVTRTFTVWRQGRRRPARRRRAGPSPAVASRRRRTPAHRARNTPRSKL